MCTNMRYVFNRYSQRSVFVKCGKCPACQQEKANKRTFRIKLNERFGYTALFVTLTYQNKFCPYVLRSDLEKHGSLPVYRDAYVRRVRVGTDYEMAYKSYDVPRYLETLYVPEDSYKNFQQRQLNSLRNYKSSKVGVCYYKDCQDFIKRLRINLVRRYGVSNNFSFFSCSEYGARTLRPHFHLLLWCPSNQISLFKSAIHQAWPFDDLSRQAKSVEVAINAASYVASYVSKSASAPDLLQTSSLRQKCSYSQGFALFNKFFSLASVLQKIDNNNLTFDYGTIRDGVPVVSPLPIPKFVLNRFFPKFTGYSRLTNLEKYELLLNIERLGDFEWKDRLRIDVPNSKRIYISLLNARRRTGLSPADYAYYYHRCWQVYDNLLLKSFYENKDCVPYTQMYDNTDFVRSGHVSAPTLVPFIEYELKNNSYESNPNAYADRVKKTNSLTDLFYKKLKSRDITNLCLSESGVNV